MQIMLKYDPLVLRRIWIEWKPFIRYGIRSQTQDLIFGSYTQTVILDLLSGNINQGTIGVMLVLSGIGLLLLMFIFSAIFPSRHIEAKTDMMASLTKHSIIDTKARETASIDIKGADPVTG
jgi:hypothetical protein